MQVDRSVPTPSGNGALPLSELDSLRTTCRDQAHAIEVLNDTIAVYRTGATALTVENTELRTDVARLEGDRSVHESGAPGIELELAIDANAPAAARAALTAALGDEVPSTILDHARLVASELTTNGVRHSGAPLDARLVLRMERSATRIRLEIQDPGHDGEIAIRLPDRGAGNGFGLNLVQTLSERWGAERVAAGGTRVWAQFTIPTAVTLPASP